jgi:hypothetical protein
MQTPQDVLDGLAAVRQDTDIDIQVADPDAVLEAMYELGFE